VVPVEVQLLALKRIDLYGPYGVDDFLEDVALYVPAFDSRIFAADLLDLERGI
jgi:hypothetical protein